MDCNERVKEYRSTFFRKLGPFLNRSFKDTSLETRSILLKITLYLVVEPETFSAQWRAIASKELDLANEMWPNERLFCINSLRRSHNFLSWGRMNFNELVDLFWEENSITWKREIGCIFLTHSADGSWQIESVSTGNDLSMNISICPNIIQPNLANIAEGWPKKPYDLLHYLTTKERYLPSEQGR